MSKQEQQDQRTQGQMVRQNPPQGNLTSRHTGLPITPAEFFHVGPFPLMRRISEEMDRVLGEFGLHRGDGGNQVWAPAIEVSQADGKYLVRAELPGVKPADVKLEVTDGAIILQGERKSETQQNQGGVQMTERMYGSFYRSIPLPEGAQVEEAKARFENGMLEVTVPVPAQKETRRQIPIEAAVSAQGASGR